MSIVPNKWRKKRRYITRAARVKGQSFTREIISLARSFQYAVWIDAFVHRFNNFVRGRCDQATIEMVATFPELRRVAGFAHWFASNGRPIRDQHWWCVAPDGTVVDPTFAQFLPPVRYEELDLNDPDTEARIPTGVCMNCGEDAYEGRYHCSDECEEVTLAEFNSIARGIE